MNKKLFALLLVSAFALQLKAADPEGTRDLSASTCMGVPPRDADDKHYSDVDSGSDNDDNDDDDDSDTAKGNQEIPTDDKGDVGGDPAKTIFGTAPSAIPVLLPKSAAQSAASSAARGAAGAGRSSRRARGARFVMPEAKDGIAKGLLKRCLGKVWTTRPENIEAILIYGAKNYGQMNHAEKAAYFNAQDAQWGLRTSRALKATRLLIVATFVKIMKDVLNATEDDEDEDDVAYTA